MDAELKTYFDEKFGALDQRFDSFRVELDQRFAAHDARMGALESRLVEFAAQVEHRFNALDARVDTLEAQQVQLDHKFDGLIGLLEEIEAGNARRLDGLEAGLALVNQRLDAVETGLELVNQRLDAVDNRTAAVVKRIETIDVRSREHSVSFDERSRSAALRTEQFEARALGDSSSSTSGWMDWPATCASVSR
jgi:hypothetical protein